MFPRLCQSPPSSTKHVVLFVAFFHFLYCCIVVAGFFLVFALFNRRPSNSCKTSLDHHVSHPSTPWCFPLDPIHRDRS